ncbi:MaoC family dehydratase [Mangrovicoccus ximenensis]|uniref:MaoC family dehydratase n=1 Tax=Mangrovicoccus ximenensis TaxID=1911570 RepID=UPI000D36463E|nr:MaoC family dehydratase N-terminal domain-containing protein [Mangrovicoccus ximenensis]
METGLYFEDYTPDWSFASASLEVTGEMIGRFVELCKFTSPTFTDRHYADRHYAGRMAPGIFILSLAEGLVLDAGLTRRRGIFLMELQPRFLRPVHAGDSISNAVTLKSKRLTSKPDRGVVVTSHEVRNQAGELAVSYLSTRMIRTRDFAEAQ